MQKINTILFDLDGTLIDSNELIVDSFRETFKKFMPSKKFTREELIEMIGPPLTETFRITTIIPSEIQTMIQYYRTFYTKNEFNYIKLYPNVLKALDYFNTNNFNLGIVTTKYSTSAIPSIRHFGLDKYINVFSFLDNVKNHKPHAEPVNFALNQFLNVEEAIMVGDNSSDILAGENAGIKTCAVNWSIRLDVLDKLNPTYRINDYLELVKIIREYNKED